MHDGFILRIRHKDFSYYPEDVLPALVKYLICELSTRSNSSCSNILRLLWSQDGNFDSRLKVPYTPNHFVLLIAISNLKDVQYQVEKPDERKQDKLTAFLTKEEKEQSKVSQQTAKGPRKRKIDPAAGIRKENTNTAKAKKPDTEQLTDKRGLPVREIASEFERFGSLRFKC